MRARDVVAGVGVLLLGALPLGAETVVLTTKDGFAEFEGTLTTFDGTLLTVETSVGPVVIPADEVTCTGTGCPPELAGATPAPSAPAEAAPAPELDQLALQSAPDTPTIPTTQSLRQAPDTTAAIVPDAEALVAGSEPDRLVLEAADPQAAALMAALAQDYSARALGTAVEIEPAGRDLRVLVAGTSDAAWSLDIRAARGTLPTPPSVRTLGAGPVPALPVGDTAAVLAHDALVAVTAPDVGLEAISLTDLARVFAGEITDWAELGAAAGPVRPVLEIAGSDGRDLVEQTILAPSGRSTGRGVETVPSAAAVAFRVRTTPGAIGITQASALGSDGGRRTDTRWLGITGACGLVSTADAFSLRAGAYPLAQPMLLTRRPETESPALSAFLDWTTGPEAARTIASLGPLPPSLEHGRGERRGAQLSRAVALAREADGSVAFRDAASDMVATLFSAERLSTTLRLSEGGGALEPGAGAALEALAADLRPERYDRVTLVFAGFEPAPPDTDVAAAVARSTASARLAVEAFKAAHPALLADGRVAVSAKGFGPVSPVVCSDLPLGERAITHLNRRVEVWITAARAARN